MSELKVGQRWCRRNYEPLSTQCIIIQERHYTYTLETRYDEERLSTLRSVGKAEEEELAADLKSFGYTLTPPQQFPPDDLVPNEDGYSRGQLALRELASVVAELCLEAAMGGSQAGDRIYNRRMEQVCKVLDLTDGA